MLGSRKSHLEDRLVKPRQLRKRIIILFCFFIITAIFSFFASIKIWGERLLLKDCYREGLVFSGEMTISEFGEVNQLQGPILRSALGLTSGDEFQKKLRDLRLNQQEIINQINKALAQQEKDGTIFEKWFKETVRRLLRNFGLVTKDIQRSGQPGPAVLWLHYRLFPFKSVINLAWQPEKSEDQVFEKKFCEKRNIDYYNFSWEAGGPKDWGEVDQVLEIIDKCQKPVWIHCKGGKDRTGGLAAIWKKRKGYPMAVIFRDFEAHRIPAFTWVQQLFCNDPSDVQNQTQSSLSQNGP
jgi:protein tyrosine phosphatase (PTP) superfamily phosphohydrolase (DUF442 family)